MEFCKGSRPWVIFLKGSGGPLFRSFLSGGENIRNFMFFVKNAKKWLTSVKKYGILYKDNA